ncbi:MAG: hypothetical protein NWT02_04820 [Opitutales bacterium]|jgi:hypothetical protein|nr:hypothetical protein [Opitutales bacterium]MDP4644168.1 hypothetical protein [Opitutales bacterium]MDP4692923.1 hypothetical protein [Opitutales bacterium]MDP4776740.1 hypothetical protein [Opitutales bacterium]MDP4879409.1 hypothetical protein [Opitutales bacterium]
MSSITKENPNTIIPDGVRYARWAGRALGFLLIGLALKNLLTGTLTTFVVIQSVYFILYGAFLNLPFAKVSDKRWKLTYVAMLIISALFVFLMIATVMFAYIAAADRGERLGVPGFEGTLIFLALMQVPAVLFERKPDLLD